MPVIHHQVSILATLLLVCSSAMAGDRIIIRFSGIGSDEGQLAAALWDSEHSFLARDAQPRFSFAGTIVNGVSTWRIDGLEPGRYAISAYHDENANGELDSNLFGIPSEAYGFSNDARGSFGPPDFAEAAFEFDGSELKIEILLQD